MALSRRKFIRIAAGAGMALGLAGRQNLRAESLTGTARAGGGITPAGGNTAAGAAAGATSVGNPLRMPPAFTGGALNAAIQQQEVWPGSQTEVWTLGGSYPAPTIRMQAGGTFNAQFTNNLAEDSIIHWHGILAPAAMDGHPRFAIAPSRTFNYSFKVQQRAGTYWYHTHPDMQTAKQVYKGMAGFFIVEDAEELALGLPSGEYEIPLLIQDRRVENDHSFAYNPTDVDHSKGYLGDTVLANGTPDATLDVAQGLYRLRLLNGSNARVYLLALEGNRTFHIIGTDGGLLDKPYAVTRANLAPAERLDVLINFQDIPVGTSLRLYSAQYNNQTGREQGAEMTILTFNVTRAGSPGTIPQTLTTIEKLNPEAAVNSREFSLRTDETMSPPMHTINNKMFDMVRIDEQARLGDLETWTFLNTTPYPHPMHVHGAMFQVFEVNGGGDLVPEQMGWKDTIYVPPFSNLRVAVKFGPHAGIFLVHCHNLEHEDHGMMQNIEFIDPNAAVDDEGGALPTRLDLK